MANNFYAQYPAANSGSTNASVGTNGTTAPTSSTEVGFINGSGNLTPVSPSNPLPVNVTISSVTTTENLAQVNGATVNIGVGASGSGTQRVAVSSDSSISVSNFPATQPISATSLPLPTGAATAANQTSIQSAPGTSAATAVTVQGSASGVAIPISGTVTATISGVSTAANQTNGSQKSQIVDGSGNVIGSSLVNGLQRLNVNLAAGAAPGATAPNYTDVIGGVDTSTGFAQQLQVDTSKNLKVNLQTALPAGSNAIGSVTANFADTTSSGSITSTQSVTISTAGIGTVGMQVTGTWTGTLVVEGTVDGTNWSATNFVALTSGGNASSLTTNNVGQISASGLNQLRIRGNTVATGTAVITLRANQTASIVMFDNALPSGTNTIGSIANTSFAATQATASALNATVVGTTAAGSGAASGLITIQGNASGTPVPVSGTVTQGAVAGSLTDISGTTSGTANTSTQIVATNANRKYFFIQNLSTAGNLYVNFTSSAGSTASIIVLPYAAYSMDANYVSTEAINVASNVASLPFVAKVG